MIKLRDLEYLLAVAECGHFGKAARACHVSQPTLSGQLMKLEAQLGLTLVERRHKGVMLTPAGETLVQQARAVKMAAENFEQTARSLLEPLAGDLHVGLIPTIAPYLLPLVMADLARGLPAMEFYLYEEQTRSLLDRLDEGKLDMAILALLPGMEHFDHYRLAVEPLLMAVPAVHHLSARKRVRLKDLEGEQVLALEDGHCLREQALGYCFAAGASEDPRFRATSLETLRYMVAAGMGVTLLPRLATAMATPGLSYLPFYEPMPARELVILVRRGYPRLAAVRAVVESLRQSLKGHLPP